MRNAGLDELQAGIKTARKNTYNLRYAYDTTLMAESKEELKSLLIIRKKETEKAGLKLNIQRRTKWWSRWTWSTSLSRDTSELHVQMQKCMENTS